jgi:hypothetical protein
MATSGERNKVMKLLDMKGYDPTLIEDPAPFTVEISMYQKYGELLKNSVESFPLWDKILLVMKDLVWGVGGTGGLDRGGSEGREKMRSFVEKEYKWAELLNIQKLQSIKPTCKEYQYMTLKALREAGKWNNNR